MLPDDILAQYAHTFYGVGAWSARVWFIGLEETGGWTEGELERRLAAWNQRGRRELEEAPTFFPASGNHQWYGPQAQLHPTWRHLILLLFLARGEMDSVGALLNYQRTLLGTAHGETCLAELLPLPAPNPRVWYYNRWSRLAWLRDRPSYEANLAAQRASGLRSRLEHHRPGVVIFYSSSGQHFWSSIAGGEAQPAIEDKLLHLERNGTAFFVTRHPAGEKDEYFREVGTFLHTHYGRFFAKPAQQVAGDE